MNTELKIWIAIGLGAVYGAILMHGHFCDDPWIMVPLTWILCGLIAWLVLSLTGEYKKLKENILIAADGLNLSKLLSLWQEAGGDRQALEDLIISKYNNATNLAEDGLSMKKVKFFRNENGDFCVIKED